MLEGFLKDHVTQKTGIMMLKYNHRNKFYFKIGNSYLKKKNTLLIK